MKVYLIILLILISACNLQEQVPVITKDYVINPNWDATDNSFTIVKMKFKDGKDNINPNNATQYELTNNLIIDSSCSYTTNVKYNGESYSKRKVYFNKDNGFIWLNKKYDGSIWWINENGSNKKVLGELERNTWYLLAGLSNIRTLYYVNITTNDKVHYFAVNVSNF